jgi:hypothetical protein
MQIPKLPENGKELVEILSLSHHWLVLFTAAAEQF